MIDTEEAGCYPGSACMAERSRMMKQFDMCLLEYRDAERCGVGEAVMLRKLLALGGMRQLYWLLVADGCLDEAREIANWWAGAAERHLVGATI